jgi:hypothetical protein
MGLFGKKKAEVQNVVKHGTEQIEAEKKEAQEKGWSAARIDLLHVALGVPKNLAKFGTAAYYNELIQEETIRSKMQTFGEALIEASKQV